MNKCMNWIYLKKYTTFFKTREQRGRKKYK